MKPSELMKLPVKARRELMSQQVEIGELRTKIAEFEAKLAPCGEWSQVDDDVRGKPIFVASDAPSYREMHDKYMESEERCSAIMQETSAKVREYAKRNAELEAALDEWQILDDRLDGDCTPSEVNQTLAETSQIAIALSEKCNAKDARIAELEAELAAEQRASEDVMAEVAQVYAELTDGAITLLTTPAQVVIDAVREAQDATLRLLKSKHSKLVQEVGEE